MFDVTCIKKRVTGIGGASVSNLKIFNGHGYTGIGFLEDIWNSLTPVEDFIKMKDYFNNERK